MPTLQHPTGCILSANRRREIASLARQHDLWIVEDDVYAVFAAGTAPPPLASFIPDRTIYISSVSKALAPGLRTGYLLVPNDDILDRVTGAIRALSYAPGTIGSLIVSQWIDDGTADQICGEMQEALSVTSAAAQATLGGETAPGRD